MDSQTRILKNERIEDAEAMLRRLKLAAGDMILYPSTSLHNVTPVTSGARIASFFWIQSMIRSDTQRALLFDLDMSIQRLGAQVGLGDPSIVQMTGVYHNLLRMWAEM